MPELSEIEREVIALFVRLATLLSLPRSVGELYGLLYLSPSPLCLNDCMTRLGLSKGAVSQGLRILRGFGAARLVYIPGDRRDFYSAETELRRMMSGFIAEQLQPQLTEANAHLERIEQMLAASGGNGELNRRVRQLRKWQKRAARILPPVMRVISPREHKRPSEKKVVRA